MCINIKHTKKKLASAYTKQAIQGNSKIAYKSISVQRRVAEASAKIIITITNIMFPNDFAILFSFLNLYLTLGTSWNSVLANITIKSHQARLRITSHRACIKIILKIFCQCQY